MNLVKDTSLHLCGIKYGTDIMQYVPVAHVTACVYGMQYYVIAYFWHMPYPFQLTPPAQNKQVSKLFQIKNAVIAARLNSRGRAACAGTDRCVRRNCG